MHILCGITQRMLWGYSTRLCGTCDHQMPLSQWFSLNLSDSQWCSITEKWLQSVQCIFMRHGDSIVVTSIIWSTIVRNNCDQVTKCQALLNKIPQMLLRYIVERWCSDIALRVCEYAPTKESCHQKCACHWTNWEQWALCWICDSVMPPQTIGSRVIARLPCQSRRSSGQLEHALCCAGGKAMAKLANMPRQRLWWDYSNWVQLISSLELLGMHYGARRATDRGHYPQGMRMTDSDRNSDSHGTPFCQLLNCALGTIVHVDKLTTKSHDSPITNSRMAS